MRRSCLGQRHLRPAKPLVVLLLVKSGLTSALPRSHAQVLYALALVPVGLLADRVDRPRLLSLGIALWSAGLTTLAMIGTAGILRLLGKA